MSLSRSDRLPNQMIYVSPTPCQRLEAEKSCAGCLRKLPAEGWLREIRRRLKISTCWPSSEAGKNSRNVRVNFSFANLESKLENHSYHLPWGFVLCQSVLCS